MSIAKIFGGIAVSLSVGLAGLMSAHSLCACTSAERNLTREFEVSPRSDPAIFRANLLKKLPPGTPVEEIYVAVGGVTRGSTFSLESHRNDPVERARRIEYMTKKCRAEPAGQRCDFLLETQWWGQRRVGFHLDLVLDRSRLVDLQVTPYSTWGGSATE